MFLNTNNIKDLFKNDLSFCPWEKWIYSQNYKPYKAIIKTIPEHFDTSLKWNIFLKSQWINSYAATQKCKFLGESNVLQYFGNIRHNLATPNVFANVEKIINHIGLLDLAWSLRFWQLEHNFWNCMVILDIDLKISFDILHKLCGWLAWRKLHAGIKKMSRE